MIWRRKLLGLAVSGAVGVANVGVAGLFISVVILGLVRRVTRLVASFCTAMATKPGVGAL